MEKIEMPVGFSMALAMHPEAMQAFALLSEDQKQQVIAGTHSIESKEEMRRYVSGLVLNRKTEGAVPSPRGDGARSAASFPLADSTVPLRGKE